MTSVHHSHREAATVRSQAESKLSQSTGRGLLAYPIRSLAAILLAFNPRFFELGRNHGLLATKPRLRSEMHMMEAADVLIKLPSDWLLGGAKSSQVTQLAIQLAGLNRPPVETPSKREVGVVREVLCQAIAALHRYNNLSSGPVKADPELSASFLGDLGLEELSPLLEQLPKNLVAGASGPSAVSTDLRRFLVSVSRPIADNPFLVSLLDEVPLEKMLGTDNVDEELHRVVHYCFVLDLVTRVLANNPGLGAAAFALSRSALRDTPHRSSLFEQAKIFAIERSLELFNEHRLGLSPEPIPARFAQVGLPFNILEAVLQDAFIGRLSNALAGVPLMLAQPGHEPASVSSDARKAVKVHMPLPQEWQHLYISWNLAFCSMYADWPYFAAPLLIPCVSGAPADEFIFHRAYALYLHIVAQVRNRDADDLPVVTPVQALRDWRNDDVADVWGEINLRAATEFYLKCKAVQESSWNDDLFNVEKVVRVLKSDIPEILRREPNWDTFAEDFTVVNQKGGKVEGLGPNKQLLQLLIQMRSKLDVKDDIKFFPIADNGGFGEIPKFLVARWKVRIGDEKFPIDVKAETVFYLNDNNKVDYMRIDEFLVNGQQYDVWPEVNLSEDTAQNIKKIEEWIQNIRRGAPDELKQS